MWILFQTSHYIKGFTQYLPHIFSCYISILWVVPTLSAPQAGVSTQCVKSDNAMKLSVSCCIFLSSVWKSTRSEAENAVEKQDLFPGKDWKETESQWGSGDVWAPQRDLKIIWGSCSFFPLFFFFCLCFVIRDVPHKYSGSSSSNCRGGKLGCCAWEENGGGRRSCKMMCRGRERKELF